MMLNDINNFAIDSFSEDTLERLIAVANREKIDYPTLEEDFDKSIIELQKELDRRKKTE